MHLFELVHSEDAPRVSPVSASLFSKARAEAGISDEDVSRTF